MGAGNISEDASGHWFLNVTVKGAQQAKPLTPAKAIGIDLGLKDLAAFSDEAVANVAAPQFYRDLEPALAIAQRANKPQRVNALHAKIRHRRKDFLHKLTTWFVREYGLICIGDVSSSALTQTSMAKSVLDAGWGALRTQLQYKGDDALRRESRFFRSNSTNYG